MFSHSPSLETREQRIEFARPIRLSVSPGNMAQYLRLNGDIDVRHVPPQCPGADTRSVQI
jgi:hypothetical protein